MSLNCIKSKNVNDSFYDIYILQSVIQLEYNRYRI